MTECNGFACKTLGCKNNTVVGLYCLVAALLVAEDEIDPLVQMVADVVAFERLAVELQKMLGVLGPFWQLDMLSLKCNAD